MRPLATTTLLAILSLCVGASAAPGMAPAPAAERSLDLGEAKRLAAEMLERGDYRGARPLLEQIASIDAADFGARYNLACVLAREGDAPGAAAALRAAIGVGFVDFGHMLRDPDLAPLRGGEVFETVRRDWRAILDVRGEADLRAAKEALGPRYTHVRDDDLRIHILSSFREAPTGEAHEELRRVARFVDEAMFDTSSPEDRPDPWVLVVLPTREHFLRFVPFEGVGGVYDHDRRTLATRDLGPSLRHEFVHVLHHRRMTRLGQRHAFWLQEGLASIVERVERDGGGESDGLRPRVNWRMNIARRLAEPRRLTPWEQLFGLDARRFMTTRPQAMYAQSYAAAMMLHELGELRRWMAAYERGFDEDPTGVGAFVEVLGVPSAQAQRAFRDWVAAQPSVADSFSDGSTSLGASLTEGADEGPRVATVFARRPRAADPAAGLRPRDVLLSVNGAPTRTVGEAVQALEGLAPGERVVVEVRRGRLSLEFEVELVAYDERRAHGASGGFAAP